MSFRSSRPALLAISITGAIVAAALTVTGSTALPDQGAATRGAPAPPRGAPAPGQGGPGGGGFGGRGRGGGEASDLAPKTPYLPRTPAEEAKGFMLPTGYRMELVASDPDVISPAVVEFDGNGRMYVV